MFSCHIISPIHLDLTNVFCIFVNDNVPALLAIIHISTDLAVHLQCFIELCLIPDVPLFTQNWKRWIHPD